MQNLKTKLQNLINEQEDLLNKKYLIEQNSALESFEKDKQLKYIKVSYTRP